MNFICYEDNIIMCMLLVAVLNCLFLILGGKEVAIFSRIRENAMFFII